VTFPGQFMFLNNPSFRYVRTDAGGVRVFSLAEDLVWDASLNGGSCCVRVPAGFETDFASVPRLFWRLFPPIGDWMRAAAMHDYLYEKTRASKALADAMFWEGLIADDVSAWTRRLMYWAVRLFGGRKRGF